MNKKNLISSFFVFILLTYFSHRTLWFWVEMVMVAILFLFLFSKEKLSKFIYHKVRCLLKVLKILFIRLRKLLNIQSSLGIFLKNHTYMLNLFKCVSVNIEDFFLRNSVNVVKYTSWFSTVKPVLLSWSNTNWWSWYGFANTVFKNFACVFKS